MPSNWWQTCRWYTDKRKVSFLPNEIKRKGLVFWRESLRENAGISSEMLHSTPIFTPLVLASLPFGYFYAASFDLRLLSFQTRDLDQRCDSPTYWPSGDNWVFLSSSKQEQFFSPSLPSYHYTGKVRGQILLHIIYIYVYARVQKTFLSSPAGCPGLLH